MLCPGAGARVRPTNRTTHSICMQYITQCLSVCPSFSFVSRARARAFVHCWLSVGLVDWIACCGCVARSAVSTISTRRGSAITKIRSIYYGTFVYGCCSAYPITSAKHIFVPVEKFVIAFLYAYDFSIVYSHNFM